MSKQKDLHPAVKEFMSQSPVKMYIGGQWLGSADKSTFQTLDPGGGSPLATVAQGKTDDIDKAVAAARDAFRTSGWASMPVNDRAVLLHRLADLVDKHCDELAQLESLDVGKPLACAKTIDIPNVAQTLRWYADFAVHTRLREPIPVSGHEARQVRFPYGVAALVLPWNFPMLLVGWNLSPALAAGNTAVIKPAEDTPLSTLYFCKLVQEAGIPAGVVNVVPGYGETAGKALSEHPRINRMGFTGSPEVGRLIASACGKNLVPVKLELGGKGAAVVFDDVDVDNVAQQLVAAVSFNTGQVCCTATRWMLHEKIWDKFVPAAKEKMQAIRIGHGFASDTEMGPAVSEKQQQRILGYLEKGQAQGADAILPGGKAEVKEYPQGFYVKPTLLTGDPDNICCEEEIFGPVAYLIKFKDEDEVVELVNRSNYGLANSVWTDDLERANRVAEAMVAGNSWINAHNVFPHGVPYAGVNLSGFGGGVLGPDTYFDYLRPQSIVRPTA
ncbi:MAG: aldehyde dehydrogenase family protein [Planctomycetota bacterium]|nr:MAG: aldehyde dehydrogenase family protein [Planctomycetota bacterium]